jgi:acetyltransferase-like isoleucine patch superfamily enzyme
MGLRAMVMRLRLERVKRAGLQIADDCHLGGWPSWGSEPYLISIGRRVAIAGRVTFITHDGGTWVFRREKRYEHVIKYGRITIHDNSFIGNRAILMPGIEIGPNSVVAAGAVVTRSVPPDSVAVGAPARVLMTREAYAEQSLAAMPDYDRDAYARDKEAELLRIFPRPW